MKESSKPLTGTRVLVGRARHQASALSARLKDLGAEVIEIPFIEIRPPSSYKPLDSALNRICDYHWLILTSVNGVEALASRMKRLKMKPQDLLPVRVAAIGPSTRNAAEKLGVKVTIVPKQYVAESVVESLRGKVEGKRVLLARAKVARDVIPRELRKMGAKVDVVGAYQTVVPASSQKKLSGLLADTKRRPHLITFTSSSTVKNFVQLLGGRRSQGSQRQTDFDGVQFASIGPITSATLRELGLRVDVEAREYTIPGLIQAIVHTSTKRSAEVEEI
jgi:uroporphyrinogen-III synthase